jgi:hypothetical protein
MPKQRRQGKFKNHVSKHGRKITQDSVKNFGGVGDLIDAVLNGDIKAMTLLGQMKKDAEFANQVMPLIEAAITSHYQATEGYNRLQTNVLKQGAKSSSAIRKMRGDVIVTNQKYNNEGKEAALNLRLTNQSERQRHSYSMLLARARSQMTNYLNQIDQSATLQGIANQPEVKQLGADQKYRLDVAKTLLEQGEGAKVDLIPKKQYAVTEDIEIAKPQSWLDKIRGIVAR